MWIGAQLASVARGASTTGAEQLTVEVRPTDDRDHRAAGGLEPSVVGVVDECAAGAVDGASRPRHLCGQGAGSEPHPLIRRERLAGAGLIVCFLERLGQARHLLLRKIDR